MNTLLVLVILGQVRYAAASGEPADKPAPPVVAAPAKVESAPPPPAVGSSGSMKASPSWSLATSADIDALGERLGARIDQSLSPIRSRLAAVEARTDQLANDVGTLRSQLASRTASSTDGASGADSTGDVAPPPKRRMWALHDSRGIECTDYSPEAVKERVRQRNAYFAAQDQSYASPTYAVAAPSYCAAPFMDFAPNYGGGYSGGFSAPMMGGFGGGGFITGSSCGPGGCR